ncbi:MAG: ABC transporter ATP-binding protein [Xanthomonadales bacterium]|nr:Vitamin B12 import ATP-binding protein BtuD [Xanthomonadales bacterium]MCC6593182.1 ABC transporter ATP-binding protein [Xanthomonadales bacterium]MCE7930717.1 ABC transporter ATP-binding protein [Xanthomonadales bacterium PRO6]
MSIAVKVEGLSKRFLLGESIEHTLSSRAGDLLRGKGLRRSAGREEFWALRDVNFEVAEGEAVGIIGGNGAGKSTLLKVLSRITPPTEGRARVKGRLSSLLEVGTGFHPELTGRENVFLNGAILGMRKAEVARKFDEIVAFSGVEKFIDTPVKRYSSGMYVRLAFAVAAHLEPDVLIIDEVLAVGDADFQKRCLGKMGEVAHQGRTVLFVSHNMAAVQKLCARAVWMRDGQVAQIGASEEVIGAYIGASSPGENRVALRPGYLYEAHGSDAVDSDAVVTSLQLLDMNGRPLTAAGTFEALKFRIEFSTARPFRSFSAVLQVTTPDGVTLLLTSTTPDQQVAFSVSEGRYVIDCDFERFPLAAGEYLLGLGLAIPGVEYVWRNDAVCRLHVEPRDVFASGLPPASGRYLVATLHRWGSLQEHNAFDVREAHGG